MEKGRKGKDLIGAEFKKALTLIWEAFWAHESAITDASRIDGDSGTISLFLIVCRIGNLNCQFGWLRGSLKRKNLLVAEA